MHNIFPDGWVFVVDKNFEDILRKDTTSHLKGRTCSEYVGRLPQMSCFLASLPHKQKRRCFSEAFMATKDHSGLRTGS